MLKLSLNPASEDATNSGFGLLETLLVFLLLGAAYMILFSWWTEWRETMFAQKVAHEINTTLTASANYKKDHGIWPSLMQDLYDQHYLPTEFLLPSHPIQNPQSNPQNNLLNPLTNLSGSGPALFNPVVHAIAVEGQLDFELNNIGGHTFQISVCVKDKQWINLILPLLPHSSTGFCEIKNRNGVKTRKKHKLTVSISTRISSQNDILKSIDIVQAGDEIIKPSCGINQKPSVYVVPVAFDTHGKPFSAIAAYAREGLPGSSKWQVDFNYLDTEKVHVVSKSLGNTAPRRNTRLLVISVCK